MPEYRPTSLYDDYDFLYQHVAYQSRLDAEQLGHLLSTFKCVETPLPDDPRMRRAATAAWKTTLTAVCVRCGTPVVVEATCVGGLHYTEKRDMLFCADRELTRVFSVLAAD